jgi:hypothetical protein
MNCALKLKRDFDAFCLGKEPGVNVLNATILCYDRALSILSLSGKQTKSEVNQNQRAHWSEIHQATFYAATGYVCE